MELPANRTALWASALFSRPTPRGGRAVRAREMGFPRPISSGTTKSSREILSVKAHRSCAL